jgi:hypothetical protein
VVPSQPGQIDLETLSGKHSMPKTRAGRVAQVVEHLPSKCEALSSAKKKEKEETTFYSFVCQICFNM